MEPHVAAPADNVTGGVPITARYPLPSTAVPTHPECRGCPFCYRTPPTRTEVFERLAGYAGRGATPRQAPRQALAPTIFAAGDRYYLLVSWYAPHDTARVMYGRTARGASPFGPYYDREGMRMDQTRVAAISSTTYRHESGVRREQYPDIPLNEWMPAGGQAFVNRTLSVRCSPDAALGDAASDSAGSYVEALMTKNGERFERPLVDEPRCSLAESGVFIESEYVLQQVYTEGECQHYCAATPACRHFSFVRATVVSDTMPWRDLLATCTLKRGADTAASGDDETIEDEVFVWGTKPTPTDARVPGGTLLIDAPILSSRGWAQGPASPGIFAYLENRSAPMLPVHLVLSFAYLSSSCEASTANWTDQNASTSCPELYKPQLGTRELSLDADGWLEVAGRGASARMTYPMHASDRRRMMQASRHGEGPHDLRSQPHGRAPTGLDLLGIGCEFPVEEKFHNLPVCARARLAAPTDWDPSAGREDPNKMGQSDAAEYGHGLPMTNPSLAETLWPLHIAPLPPSCRDAAPREAQARGAEMGVNPTPDTCEHAAAAGLCTDARMSVRCPLSCLSCQPALASVAMGFEPPAVAMSGQGYPTIELVSGAEDTAQASGEASGDAIGESASGDLDFEASLAEVRARNHNTSRVLAQAAHMLTPLTACNAPQPPQVSFIDPQAAPVEGGSLITIHGTGFERPASCRFGEVNMGQADATVAASQIDAHRLVCASPNVINLPIFKTTRELSVIITSGPVSNDFPPFDSPPGPRWSALTIFNASHKLSLVSVQPAGVPLGGNTMLTVNAPALFQPSDQGTRGHMRCHFERLDGPLSVVASFAAASTVLCRAPPSAQPGNATVGLRYAHMVNGASLAHFVYFAADLENASSLNDSPELLLAISRIYPYGGPSSGGTSITITGSGLVNRAGVDPFYMHPASGLACRFDPPADSTSMGERATTETSAIARLEDEVNTLTDELFFSRVDLVTEIDPSPSVQARARPLALQGELRASKSRLRVARAAFARSSLDGFNKGTGFPNVLELNGFVSATPAIMNGTGVTCVAPALPPSLARSLVYASVRLTVNGEASGLSSVPVPYTYYPEARVKLSGSVPVGGPTDGGTDVIITLVSPEPMPVLAEEYVDDTGEEGARAGLRCHFGELKVPAALINTSGAPPAIVVSIGCTSPSVSRMMRTTNVIHRDDVAEVGLSVSLNGQDILRRPALRWLFYPQHRVHVSVLSPRGGPTTGGTLVRVLGSLFVKAGGRRGMQCRFGDAQEPVPASWIAIDEVRCVSPPANSTGSAVASVHAVCVSLNGDLDACAGGAAIPVNFTYYDSSHTGVTSRVYPAAGPVTGGTMLRVWGAGFEDLDSTGGLFCAFGDVLTKADFEHAPAALVDDAETVTNSSSTNSLYAAMQTSYASGLGMALRCMSPPLAPHQQSEDAVVVPLRITMNGDVAAAVASAGNATFTYFHL